MNTAEGLTTEAAGAASETLAWFDCSTGAAGDMILGALLDAGAPLAAVQCAVDAVAPGAIRVDVEKVLRCGMSATKAQVRTAPGPPHRTWHTIRAMLTEAALPEPVRDRARSVFAALAHAEAAVHGIAVDDVHFHEVGALDAIGDVVGVAVAHHALGITGATSTPLTLGSGRARTAHGDIAVPTPAVLRLLADHQAPARSGDLPYEMCTPTGAALIVSICSEWGGLPPLRVRANGVGAGTRDLPGTPNVVRVVLGTAQRDSPPGGPALTEAVVVEANVDDLDPRIWPHVLTRLLAIGASDAWLTPILMKKGRPAHTLSVLCAPSALAAVRETVMTETSTIGTRAYRVGKHELARQTETVVVGGAAVRVKVARYLGRVVNVQPEYEDVVAAAARLGIPVKTALARSIAAAAHLTESSTDSTPESQRSDPS
ncbi:nickel pincer cofactor biosynthesis protein LarC [Streptomyces sp. NBC_01190]|uniref:nickel pincer cofactor biosynthesis protein LarC n=1 Tax=Streptomyces sp. NBC_01190 TaxID=2903767 RepID=UPI003868085D|nr:nickel pincer cofactor biosynthesis protein LarC [Streptomyces sp. NBC_01190]